MQLLKAPHTAVGGTVFLQAATEGIFNKVLGSQVLKALLM